MSQLLIFVVLYVVGLALSLAVGPRRNPLLCCTLAFPAGLAVAGLLAVLLLVSGVPYNGFTVFGSLAAVGIGSAILAWKSALLGRATLIRLALGSAVFLLVAAALSALHVSRMSFDSHYFIVLGHGIVEVEGLDRYTWNKLAKWSVIVIAHHSLAEFVEADYLRSLAPLMAASLLAWFATGLGAGLRALGHRLDWVSTTGIAVVTVAVFSTFFIGFHSYYIHTNLPSAVFLFGAVMVFWLAEVDNQPSAVGLSSLLFMAFGLTRLEGPVVAVLFISLTFLRSALPRRRLTPWLAAALALFAGWALLQLRQVGADSPYLSPTKIAAVVGLCAATLAAWFAIRVNGIRRIVQVLPVLAAAVLATALVIAFVIDGETMAMSTLNLYENLSRSQYWGMFWLCSLALGVLALLVERPRFGEAMAFGVPIFIAAVVLLGALHPYRQHYYDSGNRMMVHIAPLMYFYFGLKFVPLLGRRTGID
ncbi:MAG: hypothetical protein KJO07_15115 [Deltaproteobacteria bacterium]|nr:hypothetical protein [Deltaproteobacteria bacterium]